MKEKLLTVMAIGLMMSLLVGVTYENFREMVMKFSNKYYTYASSNDVKNLVETTMLPPAEGVPILMYHGVVEKEDGENTTRDVFISHMEMLKINGYTTITLDDYQNFREGKYQLPPRPIIITFDDGRKDSFYPTDDIFRKLGFKATIFLATDKMINKDHFYLGWDELKSMRDSGRWSIEAHGRDSHKRVHVDENGKEGRFMTARAYLENEKRLETEEEYRKRIETDFQNGINDIKENLGLEPKFYAVPLNDYGEAEKSDSNYANAEEVNREMVRKFFKLAMVESVMGDIKASHRNVYNLADAEATEIGRIEPRNMSAADLIKLLEDDAPRKIFVSLDNKDMATDRDYVLRFGSAKVQNDGLHVIAEGADASALVVMGQDYWKHYSVETRLRRISGRSVTMVGLLSDTSNYVSLGLSDNGIFLRETVDGKTVDLAPAYYDKSLVYKKNSLKMEFSGGKVTGYLNGIKIFNNIKIQAKEGKAGVKVWGDNGGEGVMESMMIVEMK